MAAASKFLFDTSFDDPESVADDEARYVKRYTAADLAAARAEGMAEGQRAGAAEAHASIEARAAGALEAAVRALASLNAGQARIADEVMRAGIELAATIVRKAMPELSRQHGLAEIEALVANCLAQLLGEPRVVIRVHDAVLDTLDQRARALTHQSGFDGKLVLLADPSLGESDCRMEWADGGAVRNLSRLLGELDAAVARALANTSPQLQPASPHA